MKLKREANSFQNTNSAAATKTSSPAKGNKLKRMKRRPKPPSRGPGVCRSVSNNSSIGNIMKPAMPMSNTVPISMAPTIRPDQNTLASPLYSASPMRTAALNST